MHTQHVKFSTYVAWGSGVGRVEAVGVVFEEDKVGLALDDDVVELVLEVVVVVVFFLTSPSLLLVVLLDCIGTTEGLGCPSVRPRWGHVPSTLRTAARASSKNAKKCRGYSYQQI
jgi:hypothetical protein